METLEERIERLVREEVTIAPYDPAWPESFRREKEHLQSCLPRELIRRVEHFGSTAVPGLASKPIVDILVEVTDLDAVRQSIAPQLEAQGYEYVWRPTSGDDGPPFYAWFIKRDPGTGARTHHIHMVEAHFTEHWDRLLFRDYLIAHPHLAKEYEELKLGLASVAQHDRIAYTRGKTEFIERVTGLARKRGHRIATSLPARMFVVARALFFASAFVALWTWFAISVRRYDDRLAVPIPDWLRPAGATFAAGGAVLTLICIAEFALRGRGTPAPFDPPREFVVAGPYRFVRNPMYVGGFFVLFGAGLFLSSPSIIVLALIGFAAAHFFVVLYEEPALTRRFGDSYLRYKKTAPRWLVGRRA